MPKLTVKINCEDCGAERLITKACLDLVKRCKPCQKIFNRNRARDRYREMKGIPLDKPVATPKKKEEKKEKTVETTASKKEEIVEKVGPALTPEEKERRRQVIARLLDLIDDDSTIDDW